MKSVVTIWYLVPETLRCFWLVVSRKRFDYIEKKQSQNSKIPYYTRCFRGINSFPQKKKKRKKRIRATNFFQVNLLVFQSPRDSPLSFLYGGSFRPSFTGQHFWLNQGGWISLHRHIVTLDPFLFFFYLVVIAQNYNTSCGRSWEWKPAVHALCGSSV